MIKFNQFSAAVVAGAVGMLSPLPLRAYPPQSASVYDSTTPFVVCDTHDQITSIVDAMRSQKLEDRLSELARTKDSNNEPVCLVSVIGPVVFISSEHVGVVFYGEKAIDMWIARVTNANAEFYLLWGEVGSSTAI